MVHPKTDGSHAYHLDTAILNSLASFTYTADAIRRHGAIPSVELSHSGMYSGTYMTDKSRQHGLAQWGPSACVRPDGVEVGELTHEMIDEIVAAYGQVAGLAKRAGFEMAGSSTSSCRLGSITGRTNTGAASRIAAALPAGCCSPCARLWAPVSPSNSA